MLNRHRKCLGRNGGAIILAAMIVIAILLILYYMQLSTFFNTSAPGLSRRDFREKPWHVEDRILGKETIIEMPKPPKPEIDKAFTLKPFVSREDEKRGTMTLNFSDNGEVKGSWKCSYSHKDTHYTYDATFAGNIDVDIMYADNEGKEDKSQLYFITKGSYTKSTYNESTGNSTTENGIVYVTGYLKPDYTASGLLTITTDKEWAADYKWQSAGRD